MKKVVKYETNDGTLFDTADEAIEDEKATKMKNDIYIFADTNGLDILSVDDIAKVLYSCKEELKEILNDQLRIV